MKAIYPLIHETFRRWNAHRVPRMGAALSFYTVFSLAPMVILTLSLVSLAIEKNAARAEIIAQFRAQVGDPGANMVETILAHTSAANTSSWQAILGFIVLLVGASGVFGELQDSMNQIWDVTPQRNPVVVVIKERVMSFIMVFVVSALLLLSFIFSALAALAGTLLHGVFPRLDRVWEWANSGLSLLVIVALFALIYRAIPDARVTWRDVYPGAVIAALLFIVGKYVLGFYFGLSSITSMYGAAGSLIVVLMWVYYSAQIMLFGAVFTRVYALQIGSHRGGEVA